MRLQIGQSIDNNRVRLDFRNSPDKPKNTPSYAIEKSKADEFVNKYNIQEKNLCSFTMLASTILGGVGVIVGILKRSLKWTLIGLPIGVITGLGLGSIFSSKKKNDLMDEYNVKEYAKK